MLGYRLNNRTLGRFVGVLVGSLCVFLMAAGTSAADSLDLGMKPASPAAGGAFVVDARGGSEKDSGLSVSVGVGPKAGSCAASATAERNAVKRAGHQWWTLALKDGRPGRPTRIRESERFDGVPAGDYRLCGYIHDTANGTNVYASARLDFTSIGTGCQEATAKVAAAKRASKKASKKLKAAKKKLRAAKKSGNRTKIAKAKRKKNAATKAVNKARKRLAKAKRNQKAVC
jgi:hypothetical protein